MDWSADGIGVIAFFKSAVLLAVDSVNFGAHLVDYVDGDTKVEFRGTDVIFLLLFVERRYPLESCMRTLCTICDESCFPGLLPASVASRHKAERRAECRPVQEGSSGRVVVCKRFCRVRAMEEEWKPP